MRADRTGEWPLSCLDRPRDAAHHAQERHSYEDIYTQQHIENACPQYSISSALFIQHPKRTRAASAASLIAHSAELTQRQNPEEVENEQHRGHAVSVYCLFFLQQVDGWQQLQLCLMLLVRAWAMCVF